MKSLFPFYFILFTLLALLSCDSNEPQSTTTLNLSVEDVSCTEAWLQLKTANLNLPNRITLFVNELKYREYLINKSDTLLYIDSLLPNKSYSFKAISFYNAEDGVKSNKAVSTTMDTSSNNFTWQSWTFGTLGSSRIQDVSIINENDIWAVGEILIRDSVGSGFTVYNAVHWDGQNWELKKIQTLFLGNWITLPLNGIFAFSSTDIWLAGGLPIHGDGTNWTLYDIRDIIGDSGLDATRVWGANPNDIYFLGRVGNIVHYDGTTFSKIESGTTLSFQDIYGARNEQTGRMEVLAIADRNYPLAKLIYKLEGNTATQISTDPIEWELFTPWFIPGRRYYVVGSGIFEKYQLSDPKWRNGPIDFTTHTIYKIKGIDLSDIFCVGSYGEILHFNGYRWKSFIPELGIIEGAYSEMDMKNNLIVIGGSKGIQAIITVGIRH